MTATFEEKISHLKKEFLFADSKEKVYEKIISLGEKLSPFPEKEKILENRIAGCQSEVFLTSIFENGKIFFYVYSNALVSAGLAYLLLFVYNGETPESLLTKKPLYLEELKIPMSLSMNRSNGLYQIFYHMQKKSLSYLSF